MVYRADRFPPNRTKKGLLFSAGKVCTNHREGSAKAPAQLCSIDLFPEFRLSIIAELITEPKEGILEGQVQAPDRSALQLIHELLVGAPPFRPHSGASANILGEIRDAGNGEQFTSLIDGEKWVDSIVEVRKEEYFTRRERVHEARLIHPIE